MSESAGERVECPKACTSYILAGGGVDSLILEGCRRRMPTWRWSLLSRSRKRRPRSTHLKLLVPTIHFPCILQHLMLSIFVCPAGREPPDVLVHRLLRVPVSGSCTCRTRFRGDRRLTLDCRIARNGGDTDYLSLGLCPVREEREPRTGNEHSRADRPAAVPPGGCRTARTPSAG